MVMHNLNDVLLDTVKDLYHAEKQLVKALPKMAKTANSDQLRAAIQEHLDVTEGHVRRLEEIFSEMNMKPKGKTCRGMLGIIEEEREVIDEHRKSNPAAIDAALIAAAQKVEHYEIATYGSARTFAQTLGFNRIAELLQETLDEEKETDKKLTDLAEREVNAEARIGDAEEVEEEFIERRTYASSSGSGRSSRRR
ncbi:MAG: ferritin-like domain-containing protein [Phycisphaerales bacterium]|nr:ferritin-like domain-containing protein [Phycisphaerales bacterium]MCI0630204.1 ferritin-like domain-containing protein [Phycisphaerales bacterium]MCI0677199.1 ferritin-like domain-containing protein [Phycisphaerales bacterium]